MKQSHLSCHFGFFPGQVRHQLAGLWALMSRVYFGLLQATSDLHHEVVFMFGICCCRIGVRVETEKNHTNYSPGTKVEDFCSDLKVKKEKKNKKLYKK